MLLKEVAVQLMEHLCNHDWHGYSQVSRWGDGEGTCPVSIGGKTYYLEQGDRDCSSAVISAFEAAGISCGGATYTGNMRACMVGTGNFRWHPMSEGYIAQRGDVYLNEANHTAMCTSAVPDMLAEFSISETGGVDGAEGDQTGRESYIHAYYDYPWDGILECVNGIEAEVSSEWKTENGKTYYYENGKMVIGEKRIDGSWYCFGTDGAMITGWHDLPGKKVYYGKDGKMVYDEQCIEGKWYYFDLREGAMTIGWHEFPDRKVYYAETGERVHGEYAIAGKWYHFDEETGAMTTGWYDLLQKQKRVYYAPTGEMLYGEQAIKETNWYYFDLQEGAMTTGWFDFPDKRVYYDECGRMVHGRHVIAGKEYYFDLETGAVMEQ